MYQVRFNTSFPLDLREARLSRPVFHIPTRSKYVFVAELAKLRGSDASNVHDEEPAEYELEFSDDEAEAAYKANLRERSVPRSLVLLAWPELTRVYRGAQAAWFA
jgi:H/ACA ribonucleoprotein complex non-core subunit NAF1